MPSLIVSTPEYPIYYELRNGMLGVILANLSAYTPLSIDNTSLTNFPIKPLLGFVLNGEGRVVKHTSWSLQGCEDGDVESDFDIMTVNHSFNTRVLNTITQDIETYTGKIADLKAKVKALRKALNLAQAGEAY